MNRSIREPALLCALLVAASTAFAADLPTKKEPEAPAPQPVLPSTWRFDFTGYLWASSLAGNAGIATFPVLPYYADFSKIMSHFDRALMGAAAARSDTFIVGVDFIWSRLTSSETFDNPESSLYGAQGALKVAEAVLTGIGGVRIPIAMPNLEAYAFAGVRWFGTSDSLALRLP
jgi:hypothetical protein